MSERKAGHEPEARYLAADRAELTDGVFAIAITPLALEVTVPIVEAGVSGSDLGTALVEQWPSYAAYVVTFFLVGAYWFNHHRMFNLLRGWTTRFLVLNIFLLWSGRPVVVAEHALALIDAPREPAPAAVRRSCPSPVDSM